MNNQQPIENGPIHKSVLTKEVIEALNLKPGGIYVDATLGAGGHTRAILKAEPECKIVGIDVDKKSMDLTTPQLLQDFDDRFIPLWANFSSIYRLLKKKKIHNVDGVLADFGTSQDQIFGRAGFSFSKDTPLDMRMSCAHGRV
ncbi:16S rRNA (cytosine(1402)-N(4))-methyltransferase, partial [Candidatus Babeliales bacterium]|nr:16S rRNA (cytosine(1402)-N(4))-methyltransferase [Candidatus Babeliales bacterium]